MLVNQTNLAAANTTFDAAVGKIFSGRPPGSYQQFTTVRPASGTSYELVLAAHLATVREWIGAKQYSDLRAYKANYPLRKWEATISLPRTQVDGDKTGAVGETLAGFVAESGSMYDKIMYDAAIANSLTGYDGEPLLDDAHPNQATGATADNLSTANLSFAEYRTARDAIRQMKTLGGEPLDTVGTHLVVGTLAERTAMEVTGSNRPAPFDNTGVQDASSSVVAVHSFENYIGGSCQVIVSPRITGNEWFLFDLSKPVKPWLLAEFRAPVAHSQTDPLSDARFELDEYRWSIEADASPIPGAWQLAYGSVTA